MKSLILTLLCLFISINLTVSSSETLDDCALNFEIGDCEEDLERWYYNSKVKRCRKFFYSGCGGNENNFVSKELCEDACIEKPTVKPPVVRLRSECVERMSEGSCDEKIDRFYFEPSGKICKSFSGCGSDTGNNFGTSEECESVCKTNESENYENLFILAPRMVVPASTYKAFINIGGLKASDTLAVAMQSGTEVQVLKVFDGGDWNFRGEIEFNLPPNSTNTQYEIVSLLKRTSNRGRDVCMVHGTKVKVQNFFNLIQTDKPMYKPGDKLRFWILTLDHETKPFKYNSIKVSVVDASGEVIRTFSEGRNSNFGFYKNSFTLPDEPALGNWKLQVEVDGNQGKSGKSFAVKDFKPPPFQVYVETAPRVAYEGFNPSITLKIFAKYPFDKFVKGTAKINAKVTNKNSPNSILSEKSRDVPINGGSENVKFDLKNDLDMLFVTKVVDVIFDIEFVEEGTSRKVEQSRKVEVLPQGRHFIKITKPEKFTPGFSYKINAEVFTLDGKPEKNTSIPLIVRVRYIDEHVPYTQFLQDGKASVVLNPKDYVSSFTVTFEFERAKVEETILAKNLNGKEVLQVSYEPENPIVGNTLNISVESNSLMEELTVIATNCNGFLFSKNLPGSHLETKFNFDLEVTKEMTPEVRIVVFYTRDGDIISDLIKLELGYASGNQLTISPSADSYKPKAKSSFTITSKPGSLVGLFAISEGNGKFIKSKKHELNSDCKSHDNLEDQNTLILLPRKSPKHFCTQIEEKYFANSAQSSLEPITGLKGDSSEETDFSDFNFLNSIDEYTQDLFPDVWFFEDIEIQRSPSTFSQVVPDTITTWMMSGLSIHPQEGLAIAKPTKVKVFQDFFVKDGVPSSVKVGEVFKVDVTVHNYLDDDKRVDVTLQQDEFEFVAEKNLPGRPAGCVEYQKAGGSLKRVTANSQSGASTEFLVRATKSGKLVVKVDATGPGVQDSVVKEVKVDFEGSTQFKSYPMLIDLRNTNSFAEDVIIDIPRHAEANTVKVEASLSGNLFGPSLDNVERLITMPEGCGEQKMKSFSLSIYAYKYLKSLNLANATMSENALNAMLKGYRDTKLMQALDGGFKLWTNVDPSEGIWLSAYVTQLLGDAGEFIEVDKEFYENALEYLKSKQKAGGFYDDDLKSPRQTQGSPQYRKVYLTAFVMIAIAKNKKNYDNYAFVNIDAADYLSKAQYPNDYEKAIVAYALSLSDEKDRANEILDSFGWNYERIQPDQVKALQVEIASHLILAALQLDRVRDATRGFNWLIKQRRPNGGFLSTHDTVLGLQALAAMQEYFGDYSPQINVQFNPGQSTRIESQTDSKFVELSSDSRQIRVTAYGRGLAYVNVFYEFKTKSSMTSTFTITYSIEETENGIKLNFNIGSTRTTNMAIVEVDLPSGFEYSSGKFSDDVKKTEFNDDKTRVILYFDYVIKATSNNVQTIEVTKLFDVKELKQSLIKAYDYYEPDLYQTNVLYDVKKELNCGPRSQPTSSALVDQKTTTQGPDIDSRNNEVQNENEDEFSDFRYTAIVDEIKWDDRGKPFNKRMCDGSIVNNRILITASSTLCRFTDDSRYLRAEAHQWSATHKTYLPHPLYVKKVERKADFRMIFLTYVLADIPQVEIAENFVDFTYAKCITSAFDSEKNLVKKTVKLMPANECFNYVRETGLICSFDEIGVNIGNPLVCKHEGKLYQVGVGVGVTQQGIAVYHNLASAKAQINHFAYSQG